MGRCRFWMVMGWRVGTRHPPLVMYPQFTLLVTVYSTNPPRFSWKGGSKRLNDKNERAEPDLNGRPWDLQSYTLGDVSRDKIRKYITRT